MALTVLPSQPTAGYALGQALGGGLAGLGTGLGQGISSIIELKLQRMQQEQKQKNLESQLAPLVGPEKAPIYSAIGAENPQALASLIKMEAEAPGQQYYASVLAGMPEAAAIPGMPTTVAAPVEKPLERPTEPTIPAVEASEMAQMSAELPKVPTIKAAPKAAASTRPDEATKIRSDIDRMRNALVSGKLNPKQVERLSNLITRKEDTLSKLVINEKKEKAAQSRFDKKQKLNKEKFKLQEKKFMEQLSTQKRKEEKERQDKIDAKYSKELDKIASQSEAASIDKGRFLEMKRINEEGDLGSNGFNIFVDALEKGFLSAKIDLTSLQTADAQAMKKLSKDFIKNVKETIGTSRITQAEVLLYLQTIPNLMQSPEGRARIIETNLLLNDLKVKKFDIANDLIGKNNGKIPQNFTAKIQQKMSPYIKKFEKEIQGVAAKVKKNPALAKKLEAAKKKPKGIAGSIASRAYEELTTPPEQLIPPAGPRTKAPETLLGLENIPGQLSRIAKNIPGRFFPWLR